jgi:hypothetical protein
MVRPWLSRLLRRLAFPRPRRHRRAWARPRVEPLEGRLVPATVTWVGGASGTWATAADWSTGALPGSGDDVIINGPVTVTHAAGSDTIHTLSVGPGATLQITGNSSLATSAPTGPQVTDDGTIDLGDTSSAGSLFVNAASASVAGAGSVVFGASAANQFGQQVGGQSLTLGAGITLHGQNGSVGLASATFDNQGTIQSDVSGGTITLGPAGSFTNDGIVAALNGGTTVVHPGTLTNLSSGTLTGGTWEAVGGTLRGFASGITTNAATVLLDGAGSHFYTGTSGTTDALAGLATNASGGSFTIQNGANFVSASPFSNAGLVVVGTGSTLMAPYTQTGGTTKLAGGSLANFGPPPGNSLSFNGTSDFVQVPNSTSLDSQALTSQVTIQAWVYLDQLPSAAGHIMQIVAKSENGNDLDLQVQTDDRIHFYVGDQFPNSVVSATVLQVGRWYHVAATYQAGQPGQLQIFINGQLDATQTANLDRTTNPNPLTIGDSAVWSGRYFNGLITDVSIWNVALTSAQIQAEMGVALQGQETGLVGAWAFNEGVGTTAHDLTGNHNDGSLGNGVPSQGPGWQVSPVTSVSLLGGSLTGVGTIDGNVLNSGGTLAPGNGGQGGALDISGSYTQGSAATLDIQVGGSSASGEFGTLAVAGPATFAGTFTVSTVNGYTPLYTDSYTAVTFASETGDFSSDNLPTLGGEPLLTVGQAGSTTSLGLNGTLSPTTTSLSSSTNPSTFGQPVTLTATVSADSGATPTGTVDFEDATTGQSLGTATLQLTGGLDQATLTVSSLTAVSHTITALYTSNHPGSFENSSSSALTQVVNPATPTVFVSAAGGTYNGSAFTATATVAGISGAAASALEGVSPTLSYYAGATLLPGAPTGAGTYTVVATFAGSADYTAASASTTFTITPALLTVTANDASKVYGQGNPAFTDTITGFVNGETSDVLSGSASLTTSATASSPVSTYAIKAALGTLSAANYTFAFVDGTLHVNQATTGTALGASLLTPLAGVNTVTLTANVTVVPPGAGAPTGNVDFFDTTTGTDLGTAPLNGGTATLKIQPLAAGQHVLRATYSGDGNFLPSKGTVTLQAVPPACLSGVVFEDFNGDGRLDFGEAGIAGVTIHLTGADDLGHAVDQTKVTGGVGAYLFSSLRPGNYTISEAQPAGYALGIASIGSAGGRLSATDQFFVKLSQGAQGLNYNFGELPAAGSPVQEGQTTGIGFWHSKDGQSLILALNGGTGTQLGDWLAATLPNLYGSNAGANNLAGKSNADVAAFFQHLLAQKGMKLSARVLATALSVYVTNATLDPTGVAARYGFTVSGDGVGVATVNVGRDGAAFGVANNTTTTVLGLLQATDAQAVNGLLYNGNKALRKQARQVYAALNEAGQDR